MLFAVLSLGTLIHLSKAPRLTALTFTAELGTQFSVPLYLAVRAVPFKPSLASAYVSLRARLCKKKNVVHVPRGILAPSAFLSFKKKQKPTTTDTKMQVKNPHKFSRVPRSHKGFPQISELDGVLCCFSENRCRN